MTEPQQVGKNGRRLKPIEHGTTRGYQTERRRGLPICKSCSNARRKYLNDLRVRDREEKKTPNRFEGTEDLLSPETKTADGQQQWVWRVEVERVVTKTFTVRAQTIEEALDSVQLKALNERYVRNWDLVELTENDDFRSHIREIKVT